MIDQNNNILRYSIKREYYLASIKDFIASDSEEILGKLASENRPFNPPPPISHTTES